MKVKESEEMYLETLLLLKEEKQNVRSVDVVEKLGYAKSSVSRGINLLEDNGYIVINRESGVINFTNEGREKAKEVYEKHQVFTKLFMYVGADKSVAEDNACRVEHVISHDMFELIKEFIDKNK